MSTGKIEFPDLQNLLQELAFEYDHEKLTPKIQTAETVILERLQRLPPTNSHRERELLDGALETLRVIKRDRLGFPDW